MLVSVIIPCFNVEQFIEKCINSVLMQTYPNVEIICVDNNSTDNTLKILKDFEEKFPNRITVLQEFKKGAPAARNKGLSIAKGDWIQFLDADDELMPNKILNQVNFIVNNPTTEVILSPSLRNLLGNRQVLIEVVDNIWLGLIITRAGCTCSNLYKKTSLLTINGWDETRESSQEAWLLFSLLKQKCVVLSLNKAETITNERGTDSISNSNRIDNWERYIILREDIWKFLKSTNMLTLQIETSLRQTIFDSIRFVYKIDKKKSILLHKQFVENNFKPIVSQVTTKSYITMYNLVGFYKAEKIKSIISRHVKRLPQFFIIF